MTASPHATRNRIARTLLQIIAGGGLAQIIAALADLAPVYNGLITASGVLLATVAQNALEDAGTIPDTRRG